MCWLREIITDKLQEITVAKIGEEQSFRIGGGCVDQITSDITDFRNVWQK